LPTERKISERFVVECDKAGDGGGDGGEVSSSGTMTTDDFLLLMPLPSAS
jgi:hypothetical protein